jgi:uncharacterized membrane protein
VTSDVGSLEDVQEERTPWWTHPRAPFVVLAVVVALWVIVFFRLGALRHDRYATFGFDLGIYDQATWLLAFFRRPFITVRGLDVFGHHMSPGLWFFAPFYWGGGGPKALLALQVLSQGLGAFALYLFGRDVLRDRWLGAGLGAVLLLHPTSQWLVWEFFHPEAFAIGPLLFAYWAARTQRWRWFWPCAFVAVSMKEDVALALAVVGLLVVWRGARKMGALIVGASIAWFVVATRVVLPWRNGVGPFYEQLFGDLGNSPSAVAWYLLRHPGRAWSIATEHDRLEYYRKMFLPVMFLPFVSPQTLAIALPMLVVNVYTSAGFPFTRDFRFHYSAIVLVAVMLASAEAIAIVRSRRAQYLVVGVLLVSSFACTTTWGISPISHDYDRGYWPLHEDANHDAKERAIALLPKGAATSAAYNLVPHIAHRAKIYEFPVPWRDRNWGVKGEHLDDPAGVQYLLLDRSLLNPADDSLLTTLLRDEFAVRFEEGPIVLAERVRPPAAARSGDPG